MTKIRNYAVQSPETLFTTHDKRFHAKKLHV